jgi:hypothetical protein
MEMRTIEKMTDMEIILELAQHIKNPCTVRVNGEIHNIQPFYLKLARQVSPILTNPSAREFLDSLIREYE